MTYLDKSSKTLTVGQLMVLLSRMDPNLPVVMSQEDEPSGDYGVRSVEVEEMQRENLYADWMDVFHRSYGEWYIGDRYEEPGPVVFLSKELPYRLTIDAEVEQRSIESGGL